MRKQTFTITKQLAVCATVLLISSCGGADYSVEQNVLIPVATRETYIYVNNRGEAITPEVNVLETSAFYGDYAVVGKEKKGFLDKSGKLIIPMQYVQATIFNEGLAFVKETDDSPVIAINTKGEEVFRLSDVNNARRFSEGLAAYKENGLWGFVDKKGKVVIKPQYEKVGDFSCGLATAGSTKNVYGFINTKGEMVIEPQFNDWNSLSLVKFRSDKYCVVHAGDMSNDQFGVINTKGEFVIPLMKCFRMEADKGGFVVHYWEKELNNTRAVYMDIKGKTLLDGFVKLYPFNGGKYTVAMPSDSKEFVIIDRDGKTVAELGFQPVGFITSFIDGMAVAQNDGYARAIINEKGEKIIDEERVYVADDYNPRSEQIYFKLNGY